MNDPQNMNVDVPQTWQSRFEFFDSYGVPGSTPESKAAFKALPFRKRLRLQNNGPALFFGAFYFFVKGMWRKGITLLVIDLAVGALLQVLNASDGIFRASAIALSILAGQIANYAYYLHVTRHSESWNPFEGFRRAKK